MSAKVRMGLADYIVFGKDHAKMYLLDAKT